MGEILRRKVADQTLYAIWEITESVEELHSQIWLRPDEEELYGSFLAEDRKKQWLAYRILIRSLMLPGDYPVIYDNAGKPFLAGSEYHISVTHSHELAAVMISRRHRVGIDIEKIKPRIARVKEKFLNQAETESIGDKVTPELLTVAWSAKEALYKLYGARDLDFKKNIILKLPDLARSNEFEGLIQLEDHSETYTLQSSLFRDFVLVYVVDDAK